MNLNVKELKNKLSKHILALGIDKQFLKNPAFSSIIAKIETFVNEMNLFENAESIYVRKEEGTISFECTSNAGCKYTFSISSYDPNTFSCIRVEEKVPFFGKNDQLIREKNAIEQVATIDSSRFITVTINGSILNDVNQNGKCNNLTWSEKKYYTSEGIMRDREYRSYIDSELPFDFSRVTANTMLTIPRHWNNDYKSRTLLLRDNFDTARIIVDDKEKGITYNGVTLLDYENGLKDMNIPNGTASYPPEVVIPPLSKDEIKLKLSKEKNWKVLAALKELAKNRDTYSYNSQEDINFVYEHNTNVHHL